MNKRFLIFILSLFCISSLFSVNKKEQIKKNSNIVVTGYILAKGNEPFVVPAIKTEDNLEYLISCNANKRKKLLKLQGYKIKFTGYLDEDMFVLKKYKVLK